jgi:hypothetical protein
MLVLAAERITSCLQALEYFRIEPSLPHDASERPDGDLVVMWHDGRSRLFAGSPGKLDVASLLADLCKARRF